MRGGSPLLLALTRESVPPLLVLLGWQLAAVGVAPAVAAAEVALSGAPAAAAVGQQRPGWLPQFAGRAVHQPQPRHQQQRRQQKWMQWGHRLLGLPDHAQILQAEAPVFQAAVWYLHRPWQH
eukprot:scaffold164602_cov14-Tisochrysis_lutea.AAC.1